VSVLPGFELADQRQGGLGVLLRGRRVAVFWLAFTSVLGGLVEALFLVSITRTAFAITDGRDRFGLVAGREVAVTTAVVLAFILVVVRVALSIVVASQTARLTASVVGECSPRPCACVHAGIMVITARRALGSVTGAAHDIRTTGRRARQLHDSSRSLRAAAWWRCSCSDRHRSSRFGGGHRCSCCSRLGVAPTSSCRQARSPSHSCDRDGLRHVAERDVPTRHGDARVQRAAAGDGTHRRPDRPQRGHHATSHVPPRSGAGGVHRDGVPRTRRCARGRSGHRLRQLDLGRRRHVDHAAITELRPGSPDVDHLD
jgi:hypothetical protein